MTTMRIVAVLAVMALGACYSPSVSDCGIVCTGDGQCPSPMTCLEGFCRTTAGEVPCETVHSLTVRFAGDGDGALAVGANDCTSAEGSCVFEIAAGPQRLVVTPDEKSTAISRSRSG
jgi:hypothetical protein